MWSHAQPGYDMTTNKSSRHCLRGIQIGIVDAALTLAGLAALVAGVLALYRDSAPLAATGIAAGIALLFAATVSRFEFLKGFGIEAKVRRLDATIDKAEQALSQLQALTMLTSRTTIQLSSTVGRWGGLPDADQRNDLLEDFGKILQETGVTDSEIRAIKEPMIHACINDLIYGMGKVYERHSSPILPRLEGQLHKAPQLTLEQQQENSALSGRVWAVKQAYSTFMGELWKLPLGRVQQAIDDFLNTVPEFSDDEKQQLALDFVTAKEEIAYLIDKQSFRNIQFWRDTFPSG